MAKRQKDKKTKRLKDKKMFFFFFSIARYTS